MRTTIAANEPERTAWFDADSAPARPGVYERRAPAGPYACWDGRHWRGDAGSVAAAASREDVSADPASRLARPRRSRAGALRDLPRQHGHRSRRRRRERRRPHRGVPRLLSRAPRHPGEPHAKSHLERRHQLRPRARAGRPLSGVAGDRNRLRLARQAHHGSGRLQAHQQANRQGDRQGRHRQGHQAGQRRVRRPERRGDQGSLSEVDADDRDRDLRSGRRDSLHLPREAVLPRAGRQGREGLRAAARGDEGGAA